MTKDNEQKYEEPVKSEPCPQEQHEEHSEKTVPHSYRSMRHSPSHQKNIQNRRTSKPQSSSAGSFFKNLLPKNLETGDLMVILLLLLMAGDCSDDHNYALLTLAIYCFM